MTPIYSSSSVKLNGKILQFAPYVAVVMVAAGCSGINVSKSVSPATFLMPGLLQADPPPPTPDPAMPIQQPAKQIAQAQ